MKQSATYNCYSRRLMYWFGVHDLNYIDKFTNPNDNRPYWTFEYDDKLRNLLTAWDEFKANKTI